jgi:hypothetical protein
MTNDERLLTSVIGHWSFVRNTNAPSPANCQGRGVKPRGTTLLEPENRPRSVAVDFKDHSTPDNGGASGANYYVSRFTFHVLLAQLPGPFVGVVAASFPPSEAL